MSSGALSFMLEKTPNHSSLDISDHCNTVSTRDSLSLEKSGRSKRGSRRPSGPDNSKSALGAFVEEMNESFTLDNMDSPHDLDDLLTVDSRSPNLSASRSKLTGDRPKRKPEKNNCTLGVFVKEMNDSCTLDSLISPRDLEDLQTVDSRSPNLSASRSKLAGDRPKRKPTVKRTKSPEKMHKQLPVTFARSF